MHSEYMDKFSKLKGLSSEEFLLNGDRMIVEVLPKEELKSAGGLILKSDLKGYKTETETNRPTIAIVLAVGNGYEDEDGNDEPHPYKPGEVLFVAPMGLKYLSEFPGLHSTNQKIAITQSSEVHMSWSNVEAYEKFKAVLSE